MIGWCELVFDNQRGIVSQVPPKEIQLEGPYPVLALREFQIDTESVSQNISVRQEPRSELGFLQPPDVQWVDALESEQAVRRRVMRSLHNGIVMDRVLLCALK